MRIKTSLAVALLLVSAGAHGQQAGVPAGNQPKATPEVGSQTPAAQKGGLVVIYQIDLDPSGTAFAFGKPVLEGNAYVFTAWPERTTARLDKSKVKKISQRTKNPDDEVVYQIDLVPTGRMIARENPTLKGTNYVFHTWRDGTLMSLRKSDVQKVTKVTGLAAFRIQQEERGASLNANLPMEGGTATVLPVPGAPAAAPAPAPGNWTYEGQPGVTDAYAPPSATVSSPGDVPKAAPQPTPPPR
jgi:hypothetical protein